MTIEIIEPSAGSNFAFRSGQFVSDFDYENKELQSEWNEILKEQVRCGHAIDITGTPKADSLISAYSLKKERDAAILTTNKEAETSFANEEVDTSVIKERKVKSGIETR